MTEPLPNTPDTPGEADAHREHLADPEIIEGEVYEPAGGADEPILDDIVEAEVIDDPVAETTEPEIVATEAPSAPDLSAVDATEAPPVESFDLPSQFAEEPRSGPAFLDPFAVDATQGYPTPDDEYPAPSGYASTGQQTSWDNQNEPAEQGYPVQNIASAYGDLGAPQQPAPDSGSMDSYASSYDSAWRANAPSPQPAPPPGQPTPYGQQTPYGQPDPYAQQQRFPNLPNQYPQPGYGYRPPTDAVVAEYQPYLPAVVPQGYHPYYQPPEHSSAGTTLGIAIASWFFPPLGLISLPWAIKVRRETKAHPDRYSPTGKTTVAIVLSALTSAFTLMMVLFFLLAAASF